MSLLSSIQQIAISDPERVALQSHQQTVSYSELLQQVYQVAKTLHDLSPKVIALYAENSPAWVVIDLACQYLDVCLLPLPTFFSEKQISHAIESTEADILLLDTTFEPLLSTSGITDSFSSNDDVSITNQALRIYKRPVSHSSRFPEETGKITFTSGSTGTPKGVCLSNQHILTIASSLYSRLQFEQAKHLSLLPLSTLLENIAGIYSPLLSGGSIVLLPAKETGLLGSSKLDVKTLLGTLSHYQPETLILIPELLRVLLAGTQQGWVPPQSLKYIAVGGAKVSADLIHQAQQMGLPVYEGYGLSECASVVCLNTQGHHLAGSVGKPLGHTDISIEDDEIIVNKPLFLGYLNQPESWYPTSLKTGDLGYQDEAHFVHINGRKKNILISSFGRNISPEWLESELLNHFYQAIVFGDQQPYCIALLTPFSASISNEQIQAVIDPINQKLPDYARINKWLTLSEPLSVEKGLLTETGKLKRAAIYQHYEPQISRLYEKP